MKKGQTLTYNGKQVSLWPMPIISIIQLSGSNSFSHCCGNPVDCVGTTVKAEIYAPFDCKVVGHTDGNGIIVQSVDKVITPSGIKYVTASFTHCDTEIKKKNFKQGDLLYKTGTAGMATGDHLHLDQTLDRFTSLISYGVTCKFGNACWALPESVSPEKVFFANGSASIATMGLEFKEYKGGVPGNTSNGNTLSWVIPEDNRYLTQEEIDNNAKCVYGYFHARGWSLNCVCGMLGNMRYECGINPNMWETNTPYPQPASSRGFGLVQWTPYSKIIDWLKEQGVWEKNIQEYGNEECHRIVYEEENGLQWYSTQDYPMSFSEFIHSKESPEYLAYVFLRNYERPFNPNQPARQTEARRLYEMLKNWDPVEPGGIDKNFWNDIFARIRRKFAFLYMRKKK